MPTTTAWQPALDRNTVRDVLAEAVSCGAGFAELFLEDTRSRRIALIDQRIKDVSSAHAFGVGLRIVRGHRATYGFTSDTSRPSLMALARALATSDPGAGQVVPAPFTVPAIDLGGDADWDAAARVDLLRRADRAARARDARIAQVEASIEENTQRVLVANTEGVWVTEARPYARMFIQAIAAEGGSQQVASRSPGRAEGATFLLGLDVEALAEDAAEAAAVMLAADHCPAGRMPVIIDKGFGGVIFHEACGHLLETTSVAPGASIFAGRLGEEIAHPAVTAIDDGTLVGEWGSIGHDDEGMPTQRTVLIREGRLEAYLADRIGSERVGVPRSGSGRRQSYRFAPASRMRNTFIAPGDASLEELIADVPYGLYARRMGGGSVVPGTGDFNFSVREAFIIRDGRLAEPVRGATLLGNGADILKRISRVGKDLELAAGMCGSISGSIPVNVGQPPLRVDEITVGGRS
ncbi:MAG: TldD/PmbA family protein [Candidatus Sericytochromatia bacterium]|nr:TldD/PmbA family protein [Candidatus Sericytochromatia bacterium]